MPGGVSPPSRYTWRSGYSRLVCYTSYVALACSKLGNLKQVGATLLYAAYDAHLWITPSKSMIATFELFLVHIFLVGFVMAIFSKKITYKLIGIVLMLAVLFWPLRGT
jgi:hypothetical protein